MLHPALISMVQAIQCHVVDLIVQEMDNRFSEASTDILSCIACVDPRDSFSQLNVDQPMHFVALYHENFAAFDCSHFLNNLVNFIDNVRHDPVGILYTKSLLYFSLFQF